MTTDTDQEFLISKGGPFYELQRQVGLVSERADRAVSRTLVFLLLTAIVPIFLQLLDRGVGPTIELLKNPDFMTRFVLIVVIAIMMEKGLEERLREILARFNSSGLFGPEQKEQGAALVAKTLRLRSSAIAEIGCLAVAFVLSLLPFLSATAESETLSLVLDPDGSLSLTPTGWWVLLVSSPIFWFLTIHWLWRIVLWSILLHWISRLDLRLAMAHPDKSGGIAFIGKYPNAFAPFVFAFSSVIAAIVYRQIEGKEMSVETFGVLMSVWLGIVLVAFLAPLTSFVFPLGRLKEATLQEVDIIDTQLNRANEREILGAALVGPADEPLADGEDLPSDPSSLRKAADALRLRPFSREAIVPLAAAALVPLLIAGSSVLPFKELLKIAKKLLLF